MTKEEISRALFVLGEIETKLEQLEDRALIIRSQVHSLLDYLHAHRLP